MSSGESLPTALQHAEGLVWQDRASIPSQVYQAKGTHSNHGYHGLMTPFEDHQESSVIENMAGQSCFCMVVRKQRLTRKGH